MRTGAGCGSEPRSPGPFDDLRDSEVLGAARTGPEERLILVSYALGGTINGSRVLGVHNHHGVERLQFGEVGLQFVGLEMGELVDSGMEQEAFESEHAVVVQLAESGTFPWDRPTPEADVDEDLIPGVQALVFESGSVDCGLN